MTHDCYPEKSTDWLLVRKDILFRRCVRILHSARMKICIFEPFPAYGKVGVNQKVFSRHEFLLKDQNCVLYIN